MTSRDFVIWLRGFTEACNDYTATPKQWDRIKEVLDDVEDYDDNPGIDVEIDDWGSRWSSSPSYNGFTLNLTGSGITATNFPTSSNGTSNYSATVWNDKMGNWHYTNHPDGFGYYDNNENKKQQLND